MICRTLRTAPVLVCSLGTAAAQWIDGELVVRTSLPVTGAFGMVVLGGGPSNLPLLGGSLLVSPALATMTVVAGGVPMAPGNGAVGMPFLISSPALLGATFWFQAGFVDAAAVQTVSLTNGLQLVFG